MITFPFPHARRILCALAVAALALAALPLATASPNPDATSPGEAIYRFGRLPSGQPLMAEREGGIHTEGAAVACVNCHRRSGLGAVEGRGYIPPITGQFLFHANTENRQEHDLPFVEGARPNRDPYTDASLAHAIRDGVDVSGKPLSVLMPHFALDDVSMASLIAYLKQLSPKSVPGVGDKVLQFATIVTPDADPVKRAATLAVLNDFFAEKNATARLQSPRMYSYRKQMFKVIRGWQLHVWELTGAAETWETQLHQHFASEPVFAVISGIGGRNWAPVHHFCEQAKLPCLFPNVQLPVVAEDDFHTLYFSKGVLLEAGLISHQLQDGTGGHPIPRLVQVFRANDIGAAAAKALEAALHERGISVANRVLKGNGRAELAASVSDAGPNDGLVLWLRQKDLAALDPQPPKTAAVWISGLMGGLENAPLPTAWRGAAYMAYPFDLPDRRRIRVDYPLGWFRYRHVPVTDLQVQADTYLACGLLSETLNHMVDTFVPDYLVERMEEMLEHRVITGYYPHLALAEGQRFASKGGYIVRFAEGSGTKLLAASDWLVP